MKTVDILDNAKQALLMGDFVAALDLIALAKARIKYHMFVSSQEFDEEVEELADRKEKSDAEYAKSYARYRKKLDDMCKTTYEQSVLGDN